MTCLLFSQCGVEIVVLGKKNAKLRNTVYLEFFSRFLLSYM